MDLKHFNLKPIHSNFLNQKREKDKDLSCDA